MSISTILDWVGCNAEDIIVHCVSSVLVLALVIVRPQIREILAGPNPGHNVLIRLPHHSLTRPCCPC